MLVGIIRIVEIKKRKTADREKERGKRREGKEGNREKENNGKGLLLIHFKKLWVNFY